MLHSWRHKRSGWIGLWMTCSRCRRSCLLQGCWSGWPLKGFFQFTWFNHSMILYIWIIAKTLLLFHTLFPHLTLISSFPVKLEPVLNSFPLSLNHYTRTVKDWFFTQTHQQRFAWKTCRDKSFCTANLLLAAPFLSSSPFQLHSKQISTFYGSILPSFHQGLSKWTFGCHV